MDLAELVREAQRGDVLAMSRLLDVLGPYVGRICGAVALQAGEDAAQETLLCVFRRLRSLRDPNALYAWVRTTALREAVRASREAAGTGSQRAPEVLPGPERSDPELAGGRSSRARAPLARAACDPGPT